MSGDKSGGVLSRFVWLIGLIATALATIAVAPPAAAQESGGLINAIRVDGNQRIEAATVESYMSIAVGDRFDNQLIDRSLKTLFATGLFGTVAVESKFTEILSSKTAKFSPAYDGAVARLAEASWRSMYESLLSDPKRFGKLDAAQLVKHYLGMRHSLTDEPGENVLMYVFWEPLNATDLPEFSSHRSEVDHFAAEVADSAVRFVSLSHSELWTAWEASCEWPHLPEHIGALRARYEVNVRPPAA
ncbi:MAG: hypothetical protein IH968_15330 [Gemmatimonadetes bacterium]|nr:hypothetical protein [Gemmatimonadota bacterium]